MNWHVPGINPSLVKDDGWQPIETAPKDGTWVLLRGGTVRRGDMVGPSSQPAVVAHWIAQGEDYLSRTNFWAVAYWDGDWYTHCESPKEWMPIPGEAEAAQNHGCGAKLAPGQHFTFCGETDMGQTDPALCTECRGPFKRA